MATSGLLSLPPQKQWWGRHLHLRHWLFAPWINQVLNHKLLFYFNFLIEFIGVILVHNTTQVSSIQLNKTSPAHCPVRLPPKVKPFPPPLSLLYHFHLLLPPFPARAVTMLLSTSVRHAHAFFLNIFPFFYPASQTLSPLTAVGLFYVSILLFLFCLICC